MVELLKAVQAVIHKTPLAVSIVRNDIYGDDTDNVDSEVSIKYKNDMSSGPKSTKFRLAIGNEIKSHWPADKTPLYQRMSSYFMQPGQSTPFKKAVMQALDRYITRQRLLLYLGLSSWTEVAGHPFQLMAVFRVSGLSTTGLVALATVQKAFLQALGRVFDSAEATKRHLVHKDSRVDLEHQQRQVQALEPVFTRYSREIGAVIALPERRDIIAISGFSTAYLASYLMPESITLLLGQLVVEPVERRMVQCQVEHLLASYLSDVLAGGSTCSGLLMNLQSCRCWSAFRTIGDRCHGCASLFTVHGKIGIGLVHRAGVPLRSKWTLWRRARVHRRSIEGIDCHYQECITH